MLAHTLKPTLPLSLKVSFLDVSVMRFVDNNLWYYISNVNRGFENSIWNAFGGIHKLCWQDFEDFWPLSFRWQLYCISYCSKYSLHLTNPPYPLHVNPVSLLGCTNFAKSLIFKKLSPEILNWVKWFSKSPKTWKFAPFQFCVYEANLLKRIFRG